MPWCCWTVENRTGVKEDFICDTMRGKGEVLGSMLLLEHLPKELEIWEICVNIV